jgi:DNA-binding transcriptional MocR family regulator
VTLPDVQYVLRPGVVELRWGDPAPDLLPAAELAEAAAHALARDGAAALNYGAEQGPGRLLASLTAWLAHAEGKAPPIEQLFITGGVSQALDLLCTLYTQPGDVVLAEAPTYHLALRVFRDHGLEILPVATDADGLLPDALTGVLTHLEGHGRRARFLYSVPTFGNPTGATLAAGRRPAVMALAQAAGLRVLEDDVYRHLWYDTPPPPPLTAFDEADAVIRLGSFSKLLAPGLRLGWMIAAPEVVQRCMGSGLLDSGGGNSHFAAHLAAAFIELGSFDRHVAALRAAYRARRDILATALAAALPQGCDWRLPQGGFFIWLCLPDGCDSAALLPIAESGGVSYAPGIRFDPQNGKRFARLAFSLVEPEALRAGAERLGAVLYAETLRTGRP